MERFLFSRKKQYDFVEKLSGGERKRLYLCTVLIQNPNFLILDEPTNDLDLLVLNRLEEFLLNYSGCLILVSHDRDFLDGLATKVFEFGHKRVKEHFEDIKGFLAHKKMESLREMIRSKKPNITDSTVRSYASTLMSLHKRAFPDKEFNPTDFEQADKILQELKSDSCNSRKTKLCSVILMSDNKLYKEKVGWEPTQPLYDGIVKTFKWINKQLK